MIAFACALALSLAPEGPFVDVGFDAALKQAGESGRVVFVDFFTTWCGPCKKLDATTWKDEGVVSWLAQHTVALEIDAEEEVELARRYEVRAYPTLLFINPDGSVKDRLVGYVDAEEFLSLAGGILKGVTAADRARAELDRARAAFEGKQQDWEARSAFADALVKAGLFEQALEHYLWCFDEGLEHNPSHAGVRVSFLLGDIQELGLVHPPAFEALGSRRDELERRILADTAEPDAVQDYLALNRTLDEARRTLSVLDQLIEQGRVPSPSAKLLAEEVSKLLLAERRYRDLYDLAEKSARGFQDRVTQFAELRGWLEDDENSLGFFRRRLIADGGQAFEVTLALGKESEAEQIQSACLELDPGRSTLQTLIEHAVSAKHPDQAHELAQRGLSELQEKELDRFKRFLKRVDSKSK